MLIKAGTYRFNNAIDLTVYSSWAEQSINFTVDVVYEGVAATANCAAMIYANIDDYTNRLYYYSITEPFVGEVAVCYTDGWIDWLGEGIQTLTIAEEQEVSAEFYAWFTANAVEQKEISGKWKFNENVVAPSFIGLEDDDYNVNADFTVVLPSSVSTLPFDLLLQCNIMHLNTYEVDSGIGLDITYTCGSSTPDMTEYGYTYPTQEWVYAGNAKNGNWKQGDFARTIDFGTEPQSVPADFYNWMTANAIPATASITHNGSTLAELFPGQTATLKCKGMKMEDDVVVEVAELPETEIPEPKLQEKTATENGEVLPDEGYDGLSKVTVAVEATAPIEDYDGTITIV